MAIDFSTPTGKVRLLTADLDPSAFLLNDETLEGFLALHDGNVHRAAAEALDAMATSETLLSKVIRSQDVQTNGPAVAADLRKRAAELRARAAADDVEAGEFFEVIPSTPVSGAEAEEWRW